MSWFRNFLRRSQRHRRALEMSPGTREDMYRFLLELADQEADVARLLELPTAPQLSIIDEEKVFIIRSSDRVYLEDDVVMRRLRCEAARR